ncbi:MAG: type II toxin-antitoxin system VapC family toxin [Pseudomonadota bacterium]|nr:type II toxin-antitoxin system VapC family toxin [Pseudomonadota bacterium]
MYVLDTNVVSELRKIASGKADANVARWIDSVSPGALYISVITIEELEIGVLRIARRDHAQGALLRRWLQEQVLPSFEGRVLELDLAVARRAAQLQVPDPKPIRDAYIAATSLVHGFSVASRNVADFTACGAQVLNPWLTAA